ncbi:hypothetical protein FC35_GL000891 [Limosilactobacillus coleohominis DSM 14060]|nr:hypothetical protein FC35_GL000891 [Limosilactobacillus coleohominis DSM 14060]
MIIQEVFEARVWGKEIDYKGQRWIIHSTYDDDTADLERHNAMGDLEMINAPFLQMKLAKGVKA